MATPPTPPAPKTEADSFSNPAAIRAALGRARRMLRPPPDVLPSAWAERSVRIPEGNKIPGPIRFDNAPYQREPMDMGANPDCYRITLKWGAQVGKTMVALCLQGYFIEVKPCSQMMMQPSQGDLSTWLETKFTPMVSANDNLQHLIAKPRGRTGVNNQRLKSYPGGFMMFAWSGSPKTMRGRSAPKIFCDEADGYELTQEGHAVGLLWQRAATFGDDRLLFEISTPTIKGASYIDTAYDDGDQRQFHVICPTCGHHQVLVWERVQWAGRDDEKAEQFPESARYICASCEAQWNDGQRIAAIRNAEALGAGWKAKKPFKGHASYHLNELYSTFRRLRDIVQSFLDKRRANDPQTFVNVSLAEAYEEKGQRADPDSLYGRREEYPAQIPMGALFLSAGIDMQIDRLEIEVVGWGLGDESWSIDYAVLWGDPLQEDVWNDLDDYLARSWQHESGLRMSVSSACLDTGGTSGCTQAAYGYARGKTGRRLFAIKGIPGWGRPIVAAPSRKQSGKAARKVDLFQVAADEGKLAVMRRLNLTTKGPGYCHFPLPAAEDSEKYGMEHFKQLTAERLQVRYVKGQPIREWHKADHDRNEALDCRVYAYAALKILNPNMRRQAEKIAARAINATPPANGKEEWAKKVAEGAMVLQKAMLAAQQPKTQENPQEASPQPAPQTAGKRRSAAARKRGGTWATRW